MRVDFHEYSVALKRFLGFIESNGLIMDFIVDSGTPTYDVAQEVKEVSGYSGCILDLGESEKEEVANIYHILKYCLDNGIDIPTSLAFFYSSSNKYQDKTKEFNRRVVMVLTNNIEAYLTKIGIDMGVDESVKYSITVNNGQVNLAADNSTINATQNNGVSLSEVEDLINNIYNNIDEEMSETDKEQIQDSLEVIKEQIAESTPKKSMIRTSIRGLEAIKGGVEFTAAVAALVQFVQGFL